MGVGYVKVLQRKASVKTRFWKCFTGMGSYIARHSHPVKRRRSVFQYHESIRGFSSGLSSPLWPELIGICIRFSFCSIDIVPVSDETRGIIFCWAPKRTAKNAGKEWTSLETKSESSQKSQNTRKNRKSEWMNNCETKKCQHHGKSDLFEHYSQHHTNLVWMTEDVFMVSKKCLMLCHDTSWHYRCL